jgi:hypothetical protein
VTHGEPLSHKAAGPESTGPQEPPPPLPPGVVHYETKDVTARSVARALVILVVGTAVVVALLYPLFLWLRSRAERADPPPPPMGRMDPGRLPAEPRLQTTPVQDLAAVRQADHELLTSYGWVDEQAGVVHIPIDVAMQMIAQRGLPSAAPAPSASVPITATAPGSSPSPSAAAPSAAPSGHP